MQTQVQVQAPADAAAMLRAQRSAREELRAQQLRLQSDRRELTRELSRVPDAVAVNGVQRRLIGVDQRLADLDQQLATLDAQIAKTAQIPGAVVAPPPPRIVRTNNDGLQWAALGMTFAAFVMIWSGWMRRQRWKLAAVPATMPRETNERLARLEQALDAVAIEVERISEGQRFLTKIFTEDGRARALGEGAAQPIAVPAREPAKAAQSS